VVAEINGQNCGRTVNAQSSDATVTYVIDVLSDGACNVAAGTVVFFRVGGRFAAQTGITDPVSLRRQP